MGTLMRNTHDQEWLSHSQPPSTGPTTGASNVVIAQRPMACMDCSLGKIRSNRVCESANSGPPAMPCNTRMPSSIVSVVDMPHRSEKTPKSTTEIQNNLTAPNRPDNHPVKGTVIASATA